MVIKKRIFILFIFLFFLITYLSFYRYSDFIVPSIPGAPKKMIVRGNSMEPYLKDGDYIFAQNGYYDKNPVTKEDVVLVNFSWREDPLVKFIKGVPGDSFFIKKAEGGNFNILINNEILKNFDGIPYKISYSGFRVLELYVKDYKGVIPEDAYLVMGNLAEGSEDSARFGLMSIENISARVFK